MNKKCWFMITISRIILDYFFLTFCNLDILSSKYRFLIKDENLRQIIIHQKLPNAHFKRLLSKMNSCSHFEKPFFGFWLLYNWRKFRIQNDLKKKAFISRKYMIILIGSTFLIHCKILTSVWIPELPPGIRNTIKYIRSISLFFIIKFIAIAQ